jgi:integrase
MARPPAAPKLPENSRPKGNGYEWRYYGIDPETQARKRFSVYAKDIQTLEKEIEDVKARIKNGKPTQDSDSTVAAWIQTWLDDSLRIDGNRKESTKENYTRLAKNHLIPEPFGSIQLRKLTPLAIEKHLHTLNEKGLARSTQRRIFEVLNMALNYARKRGQLADNPITVGEVKRPKAEQTEERFLEPHEVEQILSKVTLEYSANALKLIALTGLRKGEALALDWWHVDFKREVIQVRATLSRLNSGLTRTPPKSKKSNRDLDMSPQVIELLKRQRKLQQAQKELAGDQWDEAENRYVFTTPFGKPIEPRNLLRSVQLAVAKTDIDPKGVGVHTLRHSAASNMLDAGVPITVVSRILGHDDIQTTVNTYGHLMAGSSRSALEGLALRLSV